MPKPVPPPPPQPSVEETRRAVRLSQALALVFLAAFGLIAAQVGPDSFFVEYGRKNGASWNLKAVADLDEAEVRSHEGGRVLWLVGSSMLRDSFDVQAINQGLAESGSPFRAVKFGQTRGASAMSRGILRRLPLREGDMVLHGVSIVNLRRDWLEYVGLPDWRVMMMMEDADIWALKEWGTQKKVEALVARPQAFYEYHEESMHGMTRWLEGLVHKQRPPSKPKGLNHLRWRKPKKRDKKRTDDFEEEVIEDRFLAITDLDLSEDHPNMMGLQDIRQLVAESGAELVLREHPGRPSFREVFGGREAAEAWDAWWARQPDTVHFPQPEDSGYYDMTHPNPEGREMLSAYLVEWMGERRRTPAEDWVKNRKRLPAPSEPVLEPPGDE